MDKIINNIDGNYSCTYRVERNTQLSCTLLCVSSSDSSVNVSFFLEQNAFLRLELFIAHATVTVSINCVMQGKNSSAIINGAYLGYNTDKISITTQQEHLAPNTTSRLVMKGVLDHSAQVSYSGMIYVAKDAFFTTASQENKNILLTDTSRAVSIPQIEVLTNDVHCFHGSAVGRFDQDHIFYAATRGIEKKMAERLLLQAFFSDLFKNNQTQLLLEKFL